MTESPDGRPAGSWRKMKPPKPGQAKDDDGPSNENGHAVPCAAMGCPSPGIFSDSVTGSSTWWCPWHQHQRSGPEAGRITAELQATLPQAQAKRYGPRKHRAAAGGYPALQYMTEQQQAQAITMIREAKGKGGRSA